MTAFTDDDLKRLKERVSNGVGDDGTAINKETVSWMKALLDRLEAAEALAMAGHHNPNCHYVRKSGFCDCELKSLSEAWRKASGIGGIEWT